MSGGHYPVLWREALEYLAVRPDGVYVDVTAGLGGHSALIAQRLQSGRLISLDRDSESLEMARANTAQWAGRIVFRQSRFSELSRTLGELGVERVDGLLADFGASRMQLTSAERGFSFQHTARLDMRMSRQDETTAADIVNQSSEEELCRLFRELAEEGRYARRLARAIVRARPIWDTRQLTEVIESVVPRTGRLHPATRVFQALRIATNNELEEIEALLEAAPRHLAPGARWVTIAFHSLEDRPVKVAWQRLAREGVLRILTKHVVWPSETETRENPPSRSARLRACERL